MIRRVGWFAYFASPPGCGGHLDSHVYCSSQWVQFVGLQEVKKISFHTCAAKEDVTVFSEYREVFKNTAPNVERAISLEVR